ncbi:MAG TPA: YggT family protein [Longimicrobiaceae bacterium]|nr:YggT family protein [Longimicrobiaceae bacterium]
MNSGWQVLLVMLNLYSWLILLRVIVSWVAPHSRNPLAEMLRSLTDPVLRPIQAMLPPLGGFDLSPLVAFFIIRLLQNLIVNAVGY